MYQKASTLMELSGQRMLPEQDEAPNGLHLWTFKRQANAASNGVTIRKYGCPLRFICNCHHDVGLHTVEGIGFIQLERRGLHHIKSHVGHMMDARNLEPDDEAPTEESEDLDSEDDKDSYDEDDDPGDGDNAISAEDGL